MARPRQISDEDILSTARSVFIEQGPGASTGAIADALGVSSPALFKRFGNKEELMLAALSPPAIPPWVEFIRKGPADGTLEEELRAIVTQVARFFGEFVPCLAVLRASGIDHEALMVRYESGPPPLVANQSMMAWIDRARERGLIDASVESLAGATLVLGSVHLRSFLDHITMGQSDLPAIDDPVQLDHVVQLLTQSLGVVR